MSQLQSVTPVAFPRRAYLECELHDEGWTAYSCCKGSGDSVEVFEMRRQAQRGYVLSQPCAEKGRHRLRWRCMKLRLGQPPAIIVSVRLALAKQAEMRCVIRRERQRNLKYLTLG